MPSPGPGEVLVRTLWVSVDPYQRGRMSTARSYAKGLELGDVITAQAVGEVVESNDSRLRARRPRRRPARLAGLRRRARRRAAQGAAGPRAAAGAARPRRDRADGVLRPARRRRSRCPATRSSSRARRGAVGSIVGQIARIMGCRTVGIAGGADKREDLRELYRFDEAIDYKADDLRGSAEGRVPRRRRRVLRQLSAARSRRRCTRA